MSESAAARRGELYDLKKRRPFDPWRLFLDQIPTMVNEALDERMRADELFKKGNGRQRQSYRNFNVAASAFGVDAHERTYAVATSPNTKPTQSADKVCAETRALRRVQKAKMPTIIGMIVVGESQPDGGTGYQAETLWCCETCRANHLTHDTEDDSLIITLRPDKPIGQVQTAKEMVDFHKAVLLGEDPIEIPPFRYLGEERWDTVLDRYDIAVPRGADTLANEEMRSVAVQAARVAIQGYYAI